MSFFRSIIRGTNLLYCELDTKLNVVRSLEADEVASFFDNVMFFLIRFHQLLLLHVYLVTVGCHVNI